MLSPLQLKAHRFGEIHLIPTPGLDPGQIKAALMRTREHFAADPAKDNDTALLRLKVEFLEQTMAGDTPSLYTGSIEVIGEFCFKEGLSPEEQGGLLIRNGGAMLYGSVRELVCSLTARSLYGMAEMPTVDARDFRLT